MHLISAIPGGWSPNQDGVVYVDQSPGDIIFLSASDTELATFSEAYKKIYIQDSSIPSIRLSNLANFRQELTVDTYSDEVLANAKLIVVRILGGKNYFGYLVEQVIAINRDHKVPVIFLPGHDSMDYELIQCSSIDTTFFHQLWKYFLVMDVKNSSSVLKLLFNKFFSLNLAVDEPLSAPEIFLYHPADGIINTEHVTAKNAEAVIIAYRAHYLSNNLAPVLHLVYELKERNIASVIVFVTSLREIYQVNELFSVLDALKKSKLGVIVKTTGFSIKQFQEVDSSDFIYARINVPVIQAIHAASTYQAWKEGSFGLSPTDIAMNVALPELDGRIITKPISFKKANDKDVLTDSSTVYYDAYIPGCKFVAQFASNWITLQQKKNAEKKIALILPNYPNKDSRLANGVGLDTPQSTVEIIKALYNEGYNIGDTCPQDAEELMQVIGSRITNELGSRYTRPYQVSLSLDSFNQFYNLLSEELRIKITSQWGDVTEDPYFNGDGFAIPGIYSGNVFVSIQPSRGYHIDVHKAYHSPDLPPPYYYFAFYWWTQYIFKSDAIIHIGKHGNLEWLPGKSLGLSDTSCFPAAIFGAIPQFYPFIINDPGEGSQAKRRTQAVIIDHLIPPMTRAETYGVLMQLENLIDEYYEAFHADVKRAAILRSNIEKLVSEHQLKKDLEIDSDNLDELLVKLDGYLCEIKEAQIRDGLHIFGRVPEGNQLLDLIIALHRLPSANRIGITQALAKDIGIGIDPLQVDYATPFNQSIFNIVCRTYGDVVEVLEVKAKELLSISLELYNSHTIQDDDTIVSQYPQTFTVINYILSDTLKKLQATTHEIDHLLNGLSGKYIPAGGSGAPTRGRLDILPTGKNFYSIDVRTIPTEAAYQVGAKSAAALVQRYMQEHGEYPESIALSVWGTSTMRTGGDDIAQAMALMGVKPVWQDVNRRVTDFQVIPLFQLGRPRIDVMLRISGFFRDAFPDIISLYNAVVEKIASLDETDEENFIRKRIRKDQEQWLAQGYTSEQAQQMALFRVFGSKPGAYGAGLQALIDEQAWESKEDLAEAYIAWSSYAYDKQARGVSATHTFRNQLAHIQAVVQNQDNREHDILDSDDYYQFQGGLANAVQQERGEQPAIYFGDHARPDNPKIKSLKQELLKVFRSRVVNPKWIEGVKRHGYKGAFEMAATLDYMFAYDATTDLVEDFMYEEIAQAYLFNEDTHAFIEKANPLALRDMSERLLEAIQRGMWQTPSNDTIRKLRDIYITMEE
jgi:cobaltochelatase CobN